MDQWNNFNSPGYRESDNYMMETGSSPHIIDMDMAAPPRMIASDDIQINCYRHDGISEQPVSPEVQKVNNY